MCMYDTCALKNLTQSYRLFRLINNTQKKLTDSGQKHNEKKLHQPLLFLTKTSQQKICKILNEIFWGFFSKYIHICSKNVYARFTRLHIYKLTDYKTLKIERYFWICFLFWSDKTDCFENKNTSGNNSKLCHADWRCVQNHFFFYNFNDFARRNFLLISHSNNYHWYQ